MKSIKAILLLALLLSMTFLLSCDLNLFPDTLGDITGNPSLDPDDFGYGVQVTQDGGYLIVGSTCSFGAGSDDVYLIKTDGMGNQQWEKVFGGAISDCGYDIEESSSGGYIIAGTTGGTNSGGHNFYLIKLNYQGNEEWHKSIGTNKSDIAYSVAQTPDGGYIVAGTTGDYGWVNNNIYLVKTNIQGNTQWSKTIDAGGSDEVHCVRLAADGGYILAGTIMNSGWTTQFLIKTDSGGNKLWQKNFGDGYFNTLENTSDGGYIIAGGAPGNMGYHTVYLMKTDEEGNEQWHKIIGDSCQAYAYAVRITSDEGYIIAGDHRIRWYSGGFVFDDLPNALLIKTDIQGNELWLKTYGNILSDNGRDVQLTPDGGYIVVGSSHVPGSIEWNVYMIKTDGEGNEIWSKTYGEN